jgi:Spy/CpxP family protein refolding chaperone
MRKGLLFVLAAASLGLGVATAAEPQKDVFKGKLFPPNVILEHQETLQLSKEQFTRIRGAVVEVQAGVAEHEWDMREAYQALMQELDKAPIDEDRVLEHASSALQAENQVKKKQMAMLVRLKNLLTAEQIRYLETVYPE